MKNIFGKNRGMSLVEVIIAGAVATGIGLAVTKMSVNSGKSVKLVERNLELVSALGGIRGALTNPQSCKSTLSGMSATSTLGITQIKSASGSVLFEAGKQYGSSGLKIKAISLDSSSSNVTVVPNGQGTTNLVVSFDRGEGLPGTKIIDKKIRLNVNTITVDKIESCSAFSAGESMVWTRNGTSPQDIFYNAGKVAIGTTTPTLPGILFEVQGPASFYGLGGNYSIGWGNTSSVGRLTHNADGALIMTVGPTDNLTFGTNGGGTDQLVLDSSGNVFIGGNGKVGIGTSTPAQKFEVQGVSNFFGLGNYSLGWGDTNVVGRLTFNPNGALIIAPGSNDLTLGTNGGGSDQLVLDSNGNVFIGGNGNVGIGTSSPSQKLDVSGNIAIAGVSVHTSDIRLKKNIKKLDNSLKKIISLSGVEYFWKNQEQDQHKQIGLIAQEVQKYFPEVVYEDSANGYLSVNYSGLIAPLIEATKAQQKEISNLKSEIINLKKTLCLKFSEFCQ